MDKLERIKVLQNKGLNTSLNTTEIEELDSLIYQVLGCHLSEQEKKIYM